MNIPNEILNIVYEYVKEEGIYCDCRNIKLEDYLHFNKLSFLLEIKKKKGIDLSNDEINGLKKFIKKRLKHLRDEARLTAENFIKDFPDAEK